MIARALAGALLIAAGAPAAGCDLPAGAGAMMAEAGTAMNAERRAGGRGPLSRDARLDTAAQAHACWMARTDTFSHKGENGSLPGRRISATGYRPMLSAENIALGQATGERVISEWMASPGHRENILRTGVNGYGIGVAMMQGRPVWVMLFAGD